MIQETKLKPNTTRLLDKFKDFKSYSRARLPKRFSRLIVTKIMNAETPYKAYNDHYRCIFVHIPKTAGTSVSKALFGSEFGHCTVDHYEIFSPKRFHNYFKFAFVRNPWDRFLSAYKFLKKGGMYSVDKNWADIHLSEFNNFEQFVLSLKKEDQAQRILRGIHFIPQHKFICDYKFQIKVDFLGRFENINQDFSVVSDKLGLDVQLPHLNRSHNINFRDSYTDEMAAIVAQLYKKDLEIFDYKFD